MLLVSCPLKNLKTSGYFIISREIKGNYRSSHPKMCLGKSVLKIGSKFTRDHPCRSVILIKMQSNVIGITLRHGCSPVNLLHIFRIPFLKNTSVWLFLILVAWNTVNTLFCTLWQFYFLCQTYVCNSAISKRKKILKRKLVEK